uniref:Uncharacterized protein n=1 Tax=Panagrolaimus sp. JU765 TaxID=591449 RepID=A0AC34Q279_9BILA
MPKRRIDDVADDGSLAEKQNVPTTVDELENKLLNAEQKLERLCISKTKREVESLEKMGEDSRGEIEEKRNAIVGMNKQVEFLKKSILKIKSEKNRLLNPVHLCPELYADVFDEVFKRIPVYFGQLEHVLKSFVIGKEAAVGVTQTLKDYGRLTLNKDKINVRSSRKTSMFDYCKFSEKLLQLIAPYTTEVCFDETDFVRSHQVFLESLIESQKQKKLLIRKLQYTNQFVIGAVKKLNEKNIPVTLHDVTKEILLNLPGLEFDCLEICCSEEWFHFLADNSFPCTFNKLDLSDINLSILESWGEKTIGHFKELSFKWTFRSDVYGHLNRIFPNAQKLSSCFNDYCSDDCEFIYPSGAWDQRKEYVENAPQKEIVANFRYFSCYKDEYDECISEFSGNKIDEYNLQWISPTDESKVINLRHELSSNFCITRYPESDADDDSDGDHPNGHHPNGGGPDHRFMNIAIGIF